MKILLAGGSGFIGTALRQSLRAAGHEVWILTRRAANQPHYIQWDGRTIGDWAAPLSHMDAVVNLTGYGLDHWPWNAVQKKRFHDSRVLPGRALVAAIKESSPRPGVFLQISGVNHYGLHGEPADEMTPAGSDYLAQLTVQWEAATQPLEEWGVRRIVARTAVVLARRGGMFPLMALPVRFFLGRPIGSGKQAVPWIHVTDQAEALRFLLEDERARGAFNLVAPTLTSNSQFMRAVARALHRPYWLPTPAFILRLVLGEMSILVTEGRYVRPARLLEHGYSFRFPTIEEALADLLKTSQDFRSP